MKPMVWLLLIGVVVLSAMSLATQWTAHAFAYQRALGLPLATVGGVPVYAPWSILDWSAVWGTRYRRVFAVGYLILTLGLALAVSLGAFAVRRRIRSTPFGKNAWARFADVERAGLFACEGAALGKFEGEILAFDGPEHQILIGASRSGKGRGHVIPTLLAWPGSLLVLDVKGELDRGDPRHGFPGTSGYRARLGPVLRFAPTSPQSHCFNPLLEVRRGVNEVRDVQNIVEIIVGSTEKSGSEQFWNNSAKIVIAGVILHVLYAEPAHRKTLAVVREKLRDLDGAAEEMRATLHRADATTGAPKTHPEVLHAAQSYLAGEERLRSGIKATAESFFGLFADPIVAEKTATSDFRIGDLMCGPSPVTLFLQPPPSDAPRLMPLMRLFINQAARALMEDQTHDAGGQKKRHSLMLVLDEFPQLGRLDFFEKMMGAMAGYGLKAYLVCQSLNHIIKTYGRDNVILDNCHVVTAFSAADPETARRIADMAGEVWEIRPQESEHRPRAVFGRRKGSVTWREERRPLLLPADVRSLPRDEQLIFVAGCKPIRAKKLRFDQEALFARRLCPPAPRAAPLTQTQDWSDVAPLGRVAQDRRAGKPSTTAPAQAIIPRPVTAPRAQQDLFGAHLGPGDAPLRASPPHTGAPTVSGEASLDTVSRSKAPLTISETALGGFGATPPDEMSKEREDEFAREAPSATVAHTAVAHAAVATSPGPSSSEPPFLRRARGTGI